MATYLVTGIAGFIAARTAEMLLAEGHIVVGVDNLNNYYDVRLKDYRLESLFGETAWRNSGDAQHSVYVEGERRVGTGGRLIFENIDIENLQALERIFAEFHFDAVFNLAARAGLSHSLQNPHVYLTTNVHGTLNLLECQRKFGVGKLVLASTSSLYAGSVMPFKEDLPVNKPRSPYAATKKAAEVLAYSYHELYGLDISVMRYFTVFGPAGRPDMSVFRFIECMQSDRPIQLFGDGAQSRDFTYVDDIARGTIRAVKPLGYEVINLGGGRHPISLCSMIEMVEMTLKKKARVSVEPFQAADVRETQADITKAGRLLEWSPQVELAEGMLRTVEWHLANRDWLSQVRF